MSKWILAAGAAAIALATPALADPGGNKGKGGGNDHGGKAAKVERGGGGQDRGGGKQRVAHAPKDHGQQHEARGRSELRDRDRGAKVRSAGMRDDKVRNAEWRGKDREDVRVATRGKDRSEVRDRDNDRVVLRDSGRFDRDDDRRFDRDDDRRLARYDDDRDFRGFNDGCPPGLAKKRNGCLPPGQAKKLVGAILPAAFGVNRLGGAYSHWYQDNDRYYYRNDGDYIYRVNRDGGLIDALMPYGSRDYDYYPVGMNYPGDYDFYNVPDQYRSFYADGPDYDYRYGNNAIYQLDPQTNAIQSIVALLAGDLAVGQPMPSNYSMYNVPLDYRDRYYDSPDAMYRYNDGYIYRADPKTQLITAVIDAIV